MQYTIILMLLLAFSTGRSQGIDTAKYIIIEAKINNIDYSEDYFENGQYLSFYTDEDENPCFLNSKANGDEYSYGKVYGYKIKETKIDDCVAEEITFRWQYHNSYDDQTGYALVHLKRIYRENGVQFSITILSKKLDIIEFAGFTSELAASPDQDTDATLYKKVAY